MAPGLAHAQLAVAPGGQVNAGGAAPSIDTVGRTTDITLGATRTIINWSSYNLASDQTVIYRFQDRTGIVLNRVSGAATIDGRIEALAGAQGGQGNVWFSAPGGVVFGPNAQVNVGGLLATPATVATSGFLQPSNLSFDFTGGGSGWVEVRAGANLRAAAGPLALIANSVITQPGSAITGVGTSSVLYGAASEYTVRFGVQAGDLDLLDFIVPAAGGSGSAAPLDLRGETVGAHVFLAVVNRADVASAVINAPGLLAAQSAAADRGDVVLTAGANIVGRQPGSTRVNGATETTATLGLVSAQRDVLAGFASPTSLTAGMVASGRDLAIAVAGLDVGTLNAGRQLAVDAPRGIAIRNAASAGSAASVRTAGAFTVGPGGVNAIGRLLIDAGSVQAGQLSTGRSLVVNASGAGPGGGPAVSLGSAVADDDITITTSGAQGHIVLGSATALGRRADEAPAGRGLSLTARGTEADVTYGGATGARLDGITKVTLSAGRDVTATVTGLLPLAGGQAGRNFTVRADDLDLMGAVTAANVRIESMGGALTLGGGSGGGAPREGAAAPVEGLWITDAEFQFINVTGEASFYAGAAGGAARGDMTLLDLALNPAKAPSLLLGAGPDNTIAISGDFANNAKGGKVTIGEASDAGGFQPGRIILTGSIGVSDGSTNESFIDLNALGETHLNAGREIIAGFPRFVAIVNSTPAELIDIAHELPAGVAALPEERGRIWVTTGVLTMSASARILMQNTGTRAAPSGIIVGDGGGGPSLVVTSGVVDIFGSVRATDGALTSGLGAALAPGILDGDGSGGSFHFNGLDVSTIAAGGGGSGPSLVDARIQWVAQGPGGAGSGPSDGGDDAFTGEARIRIDSQVLTIGQADSDAVVQDHVLAGAGNDLLWHPERERQRRKRAGE